MRLDRQTDERTNRRIDGGADDGPFEGSMKCVSRDDQPEEMSNDDKGVIKNTNIKVRKASYDEKCTNDDELVAPSSVMKTDDLKCDIRKDGWCETHGVKTTTISVNSKVWRKNNKNNIYGWKTVKIKRTICRPKSLAQMKPSGPDLSANLGGD